jgi:hypothetical protein
MLVPARLAKQEPSSPATGRRGSRRLETGPFSPLQKAGYSAARPRFAQEAAARGCRNRQPGLRSENASTRPASAAGLPHYRTVTESLKRSLGGLFGNEGE